MKKFCKSILLSFLLCLFPIYACGKGSDKYDLPTFYSSEYLSLTDSINNDQVIKIDSFDVNIIAPSSGVQFYKDGIVFLARSTNYSRMVPIHISFGAIQAYYADLQDSVLVNPRVFSPTLDFPYPSDAISFTGDFNIMYFTKRGKNDVSEKIYQANYYSTGKNAGTWKEAPGPLNFCHGNSTYTHPTVSPDGNIMIFASDMSGSRGGTDLYITRKSGDQWSEPENLGNLINTSSNELYPSLDSSNNLYFSSDGHPGFGGYDVYVCRFTGKGWEEPVNLTDLVNSPEDEVAFNLNRKNGRFGFFTSTGKNKNSVPQLHKVDYNLNLAPDSLANLSAAIINMAYSDMTFPHKKLVAEVVIPEVKTEEVKPPEVKKEEIKAPEIKAPEVKKEEVKPPEVKKEEVKAPEIKAPEVKKEEIKPPVVKKETAKPRVDTIKSVSELRKELRDIVVYRIQIRSSPRQLNLNQVTVSGKQYDTYTYFYLREYRYTIGEFTTLAPARELQFAARKAGYPQAFVAAFKNNLRTLDLSLFTNAPSATAEVKSPPASAQQKAEETRPPEVKKEEIAAAPPEVKKEEIPAAPPEMKKKEITAAPTPVQSGEELKGEATKLITTLPPGLKDVVVYRVQYLSTSKQQSVKQIVVNGKSYTPFIYYYLKLYRYTIGEFTSFELAREFQSAARKAGHPQAFVVAFRNNVRLTDPALFR
ncbi:MAG: PD40 domain-containing protein [Bacteroidales bacterium]|nr:PD40 domain-containing protein [Bacteroidales bacterium]